jgi:hypothetical protein
MFQYLSPIWGVKLPSWWLKSSISSGTEKDTVRNVFEFTESMKVERMNISAKVNSGVHSKPFVAVAGFKFRLGRALTMCAYSVEQKQSNTRVGKKFLALVLF